MVRAWADYQRGTQEPDHKDFVCHGRKEFGLELIISG